MSTKHTPGGSDGNRRSRRRMSRRVSAHPEVAEAEPTSAGDVSGAPSGYARIVDPIRLVSELQTAIDRRALDDLDATVASIAVHGLDRVRERHGVMFAFDLVTELTAVVHRHLTDGDVYHVGEDGQIVLLLRRTPDRTQAVADEIRRSVAGRRWDDGTDEIRLPASVGIATVDAGATPAQLLQAAHDAVAASRGGGSSTQSARSIWTIGGGRDLFGVDTEAPRRVRGPAADHRHTDPPDAPAETADRDDIFSIVEYRPPAESARLTAGIVLPPQGSALGVPLLGAPRRCEPGRPSPLVELAEPAPPTHTKAVLDAIQASLSEHAAEALHAIEATVPGFEDASATEQEEHATVAPETAVGARHDESEADESFVLPVRRRRSGADDPGETVADDG